MAYTKRLVIKEWHSYCNGMGWFLSAFDPFTSPSTNHFAGRSMSALHLALNQLEGQTSQVPSRLSPKRGTAADCSPRTVMEPRQ